MRIIKNNIRCCFRLCRLMAQFAIGIVNSAALRFKYGSNWYYTDVGSDTIQKWMQKVCVIIGLKVRTSGDLFQESASLIVANHVSWLDIIALASTIKSTFISKSELRKWPIIGSLAGNSGTIFIKRNSRQELSMAINTISSVLNNGKSVILFPEGTTTNGKSVKKFKSSIFQSAINSNCNIQPITIQYIRNNKIDILAPYIDDNNFVLHLLKIMSQAQTIVSLHANKKIVTLNEDRHYLTTISQYKIENTLSFNLDVI